MFCLKSVDRKETFEVPEWFYDAHHEVNESERKWLYMQGPQIDNGKKEPFKGQYNYIRKVEISFNALYKTVIPQIKNLEYDYKNPTWCNFNTGVFAHFAGRDDIAHMIMVKGKGANALTRILQNGLGRRLALPPDKIGDRFIISAFLNPNPKLPGHVSPYIGRGKDGYFYCDNVGAFFRHGIRRVDGKNKESAFWEEIEDIEFYEISR
jgi:hypothetical protein